MTIYDFTVKDASGSPYSLSAYEGKVLLVVNTAIKCGLTPQYEALENLYKKYHDKGFELLDFPCNQFLEQAPGTVEEISQFCTLNYGTTFPRFGKLSVNGPEADPLYKWLKAEKPEDEATDATREFEKMVAQYKDKVEPGDIIWNFGKFLVSRKGEVMHRFAPATTPQELEAAIEAELAK